MDGITNYGFRVINNNNPLQKQNLTRLATNYTVLPASKMSRRVATFDTNHPINTSGFSRANNQALTMYNVNTKSSFYHASLSLTTNNTLQARARYLAFMNDLTLVVLSATFNDTTVHDLDSNDFNETYDKQNNFVTITPVDPDFDFTNYKFIFQLYGINSQTQQYVSYKLRYSPTYPSDMEMM
jgi:hypothetical protein